jgi:1-deoxy-D-xylulose-5-phosphate synthase
MTALPIGKAEVRREGKGIAILAFGSMVSAALQAGAELDATVVNMRFVKPLDEALIREMAASHELLVTLEENALLGGAGSAVAEYLGSENLQVAVMNLGLPDVYLEHGSQAEQLADAGLAVDQVVEQVLGRLDG